MPPEAPHPLPRNSTQGGASKAVALLWAYLLERFPPGPYSLLVVLFYGSAALVCASLVGAEASFRWQPPVVMLLLFFHLRVFDEQKDFEEDRHAHPDRLLSRGIITLAFLTRVAIASVVLQGLLALSLSPEAFGAWLICFLFTLTMRVEFGVGKWLNQRPMLYALTHNPITPLLGVFVWASTELPWVDDYGWYLGSVAMGALAFELGRKIRLPQEEQEGVSTYSKSFGRRKAGCWLVVASILAIGLAVPLLETLGDPGRFSREESLAYFFLIASGLQVLSSVVRGASAKGVELASSGLLLGCFGAFGIIAW